MGAPVPQCPRCGYDLSGLVASWIANCPLDALCAECGLTFDCGRVLSRRAVGPPWSVEHGPGAGVRRWASASRRSLLPWRWTRELAIDHQVRVARLVLFGVAWVLLWYLLMGAARAALAPAGPPWMAPPATWLDSVLSISRLRAVLWPYGMAHIQAGPGGYAEIPLFLPLIVVYGPALLMPLGMMLLGTTFRRASVRRVHLMRGLVYTAPGVVLTLHLVIAMALGTLLLQMWGSISVPGEGLVTTGLLLGYLVWLTAWWWLFIRRYLRLPHAPAVALLLMFTALLGVLTILAGLAALRMDV